ncbi:hypothetical protein ACLB2K_011828 [Fragaria x ananassa]
MVDPPLALDCEASKSMEEDSVSLDCEALRSMEYYEVLKSTEHLMCMEDYEAMERIKKYVDGSSQFAVTRLDFPVRKTINDFGCRELVGACNGLVCVKYPCNDGDSKAIMLWNPCTRDYKVLPKPPLVIHSTFSNYVYGFGYDPANDDYKVIWGLTCDSNDAKEIMIHIFSLKTGSWRTIKDTDYVRVITCEGLFLNGALHWLYCPPNGGSGILSFDLGVEKFQKTIPLPYDDWFSDPLIHRHCLCVCTRPAGANSINIWGQGVLD